MYRITLESQFTCQPLFRILSWFRKKRAK